MAKNYMIEIYEPGSSRNVWVSFHSETPFLSIYPGDVLNTIAWETPGPQGKIIRVSSLEHLIWENGDSVSHKIMINTQID